MHVRFLASGATATKLHEHQFANKSATEVKRILAVELGVSRYSQRLFEGGRQIAKEQTFAGDPIEIELLLVTFQPFHTRFNVAARSNDAATVQKCLGLPTNPDDFDSLKCTPLWVAAANDCVASASLLLDAAATVDYVDCVDAAGVSPLGIAAQNGLARMCSLLLAAGADKESTDQIGETPLLKAARLG
eukprot:s2744_g8.t1